MRKRMMMILAAALLLLPVAAQAREGLILTQDGYRGVAFNASGEALLIGELFEEEDGLVQNVGVSFLIFPPTEGMPTKWGDFNGGNGLDKLEHGLPTADGWIAAGSSSSSDLDNGWHEGNYDDKESKTDGWVVRLDGEGAALWTRCYGGSDWDSFNGMCETHDGGWILAGNTYSSDGDVSGWHDSGELYTQPDGWLVKIDAQGDIVWQRALGGSGYDELFAVRQAPGGYLAVGATASMDGDVGGTNGGLDGWVVLLDDNGELLSQACYGGSDDDSFSVLSPISPAGWLAAGTSWSNDLTTEERVGNSWAVCLDEQGASEWMMRYGGHIGIERTEYAFSRDDSWVLAGFTQPMGEEATEWVIIMDYGGNGWKLFDGAI